MSLAAAFSWNWSLDGWIVVAGVLCAVASALLGNFLVLRRMSLLGDAISHAVLPGLAAAFLITNSRSSLPMFLGAVACGLLTAMFTEWIRGFGNVDEGASMGVVFTALFALGLVMIVRGADHVDLDPSCVLYGSIETTLLDTVSVLGYQIPRAVVHLGCVAILNGLFVFFFFKELKISSFDPALATTSGYSASLMHYLLMMLVAVTAVASFETVGNILVVAMFVVPPAAAYMLTDRLANMIGISVILATLSAVLGHISAITVPRWFGFGSTTTSGMMALAAGCFLALAIAFGPRHGIFVKLFRHSQLAWGILADDVVALLYRIQERNNANSATWNTLREVLLADRFSLRGVLWSLRFANQVERTASGYALTEKGRARALSLVRAHRLWEKYLVDEVGVETERIHAKAEQFEHFTDVALREQLNAATNEPILDPHGSPIPEEHINP